MQRLVSLIIPNRQSAFPGTFQLHFLLGCSRAKTLKIVSYAALVLMASAVVYASVIGITYWTGIGV